MTMSWRDASHAREAMGRGTGVGELLVLGWPEKELSENHSVSYMDKLKTHLYVNRFLVGANSPNLCPTISDVTCTGRYDLPLWTMNLALM